MAVVGLVVELDFVVVDCCDGVVEPVVCDVVIFVVEGLVVICPVVVEDSVVVNDFVDVDCVVEAVVVCVVDCGRFWRCDEKSSKSMTLLFSFECVFASGKRFQI